MNTASDKASAGEPHGRSMAARYGQIILSNGIAAIPNALYFYQAELDLFAQEVWFVSAILAHKWTSDLPYPDLQDMAAKSGITVRQLRRYRANLESKNYLVVQERYDQCGRRLPNSYNFAGLFARIETLISNSPDPQNEIRVDDAPYPLLDGPERDYSFVARYGRVIAAAGIAAIPQALFTYQAALKLTPQQVWFCCYILSHKWTTDLPYPSLRKMSARTGYSQQHLHDLKDSMTNQGWLVVIGRSGERGQDTNAYDFSNLLAALGSHIENTSGVEQVAQTLPDMEVQPPAPRARRGQRGAMNGIGHTVERGIGHTVERGIGHTVERDRTAGLEGHRTASLEGYGTPGLDEEEACQEEAYQEENISKASSKAKKARHDPSAAPYSPYIAGVIVDYSRELGDIANVQSNTTQALRIWQNNGLPEALFVELLYQAKATTREYQGKQGHGIIVNRMGYFFKVLRDVIEKNGRYVSAGEVAE